MKRSNSDWGYARLQGIEYQNGWQINERNKLIVGFEYQKNTVAAPVTRLRYKGSMNNIAFYLQDTMSVGNKWQIVPGVRLDYHEHIGSRWSPKIAVNYRPEEKTKLYTSWGRVYNAPDILQLYDPREGNPNLRSQAGQSVNVGFEHAFDEKTSIAMNYFYSYLDDVIEWYGIYDNGYSEKQRGFDISFNQKLSDKWSYNIGYTHTDADDVNCKYDRHESSKAYLPSDSFEIGVHYRCGKWKANLNDRIYNFFNYANGRSGTIGNENFKYHNSYNNLMFNASYDVNDQFTIYTRINNITNKGYSKPDYDEGEVVYGLSYPYTRYYMLGATYKF